MKRELLILITFFAIKILHAQPGTIDSSYGTDGRVVTHIGIQNTASGVAIQKDGKAVVVGYAGVLTKLNGYIVQASNFAIARYERNGELDNTFGQNGKMLTKFYNNSDDVAIDVVLRPDGKIIAGGYGGRFFSPEPVSAEIIQYNTDGSIDSSFGKKGKVRATLNSQIIVASVALQRDGRILLGGTKDDRFTILRFTALGKIDSSFGVNGIAVADFGTYCRVYSIAVDINDKIVITGLNQFGTFLTARLKKTGALDEKFGANGFVQTDFSDSRTVRSAYSTSVFIQPDNKIVVGGNISWGGAVDQLHFRYGVARYNPDGSADLSFNYTGKQMAELSGIGNTSLSYKILLKPDGKIMQVGETGKHIGIVQYKANGGLDSSYGINGISNRFKFDKRYISPAFNAALQPNGKLITVGYVTVKPYDTSRLDWSIARFNGDEKETDKIRSIEKPKDLLLSNLSVYPNPVSNEITALTYTLHKPGRVTITLTDMQGITLKKYQETEKAAGSYRQQIIFPPNCVSGMYNMIIATANEKKIITLIKN